MRLPCGQGKGTKARGVWEGGVCGCGVVVVVGGRPTGDASLDACPAGGRAGEVRAH